MQQSLPAVEMLPKYRALAQDVNDRGLITSFTKGTVKIAINHLSNTIPGEVHESDFLAFLKKERDLVALHLLSSDSAKTELFNEVQRTYVGTFDQDDLWSAIHIRKRVLAKGGSMPNIRNVGGAGSLGSPNMPGQEVYIAKPKRQVWMDIIKRCHLRATGVNPGTIQPGRSVPDLAMLLRSDAASRSGLHSRSSLHSRGSLQSRASLRSQARQGLSRGSTRSTRSIHSTRSMRSLHSQRSWTPSTASRWSNTARSQPPMPMSSFDKAASTINIFNRDLAGNLGSPEKLKDERHQLIPDRTPLMDAGLSYGANAVQPVDVHVLGFRERFEFERLGVKLNDIHDAHEVLCGRPTAADGNEDDLTDDVCGGGSSIINTMLNDKEKEVQKKRRHKIKKRRQMKKGGKVCEFSKPASSYFDGLQKSKLKQTSSFCVSREDALEVWQQKECKKRSHLRREHDKYIQEQEQRRAAAASLYSPIATLAQRNTFKVPETINPKTLIHLSKINAAAQLDTSEELQGELLFKYSYRIEDDPFVGFIDGVPQKRKRFLGESGPGRAQFGSIPLPKGCELSEGSRALSPAQFKLYRGQGSVVKMTKYTRFQEREDLLPTGNNIDGRGKPPVQLKLREARPGKPYFLKPKWLKREQMFTNWRKPLLTGAAAR